MPDKSALDEPLPRVGASAVGAALAVQAITAMRLRAQPLAATLKALRRRKVIQARRPDGKAATRARRCAAAFVRSNLLFSSRDRCLLRALALCEHVIGDGGEAALIFGVKLPFAAHCWAQSQDMVLSDPWDIVADYTPILAV
ncbi:lasso peptide biosynthesis B2 protein [Caulobacter segnis]